MKNRLKTQGIDLEINNDVKEYLAKYGYDPQYGARPVRRIIRRKILAGLSRYILEHPNTNKIIGSMDENKVEFRSIKKSRQAA